MTKSVITSDSKTSLEEVYGIMINKKRRRFLLWIKMEKSRVCMF